MDVRKIKAKLKGDIPPHWILGAKIQIFGINARLREIIPIELVAKKIVSFHGKLRYWKKNL